VQKEDKQSKSRVSKAIKVNASYKKAFSGPDGETVLKDLLVSTGFDTTTFVAHDPYSSAYNEGRRSIVLQILRMVDIDPKRYRQLYEITEDEKEILDV